jgi:hypothetical protein
MNTYECLNCGKEHKFKGYSYTNKYCDNKCQREHQNKELITKWLAGNKTWKLQTPNWAKNYLKKHKGDCCEICGISEWLGNPILLECDHTDGDPANNSFENLRLLCPNCHSQTESFKGKNRGNGRKERYAGIAEGFSS